MHGERRGHILLFSLTFATNDGGGRTATSVKAVESESSRTEHEIDSSLEMELTAIARH